MLFKHLVELKNREGGPAVVLQGNRDCSPDSYSLGVQIHVAHARLDGFARKAMACRKEGQEGGLYAPCLPAQTVYANAVQGNLSAAGKAHQIAGQEEGELCFGLGCAQHNAHILFKVNAALRGKLLVHKNQNAAFGLDCKGKAYAVGLFLR